MNFRLLICFILIGFLALSCEPEIIEVKIDLNEYLIGEWEVVEDGYYIRNRRKDIQLNKYQHDFEEGDVSLKRIKRESSSGIIEKWLHGKWWIDDVNNYLHIADKFGEVDSGIPFGLPGTILSYLNYNTFSINIVNQNEFTTVRDIEFNDSTSVFFNYIYKRL